MRRKQTAYAFFLQHAGYSYNSAQGETAIQGRRRCARALAEAEQWAQDQNLVYEWIDDPDCGPDEFDDERDKAHVREHGAVGCVLYRPCEQCAEHAVTPERCKHDWVLSSLWGITESLNYKKMINYRRVVQAELAAEVMR